VAFTTGTLTADISTGIAGGQTIYGGTSALDVLIVESTTNASKGDIILNPNGGNVGIGTMTTSAMLDVAGSIRLGAAGANNILNTSTTVGAPTGYLFWGNRQLCDTSGNCAGTGAGIGGSGSQNYIAKFSTDFTLENSVLYDDGTNIGIGTATPGAKLDVNGGIRLGAAGANNILNTTATAGAPTGALYFGNQEICTTTGNCSGSNANVQWGDITGTLSNQTDLQSALNAKESTITAGTNLQYYRGDKTWQTLNTSVVPEGTNLYYTGARFSADFALKTTSDLAEGSNLYFTDARARAVISAAGPITYNTTTGVVGISQATSSTHGYLSSTDWTAFNNKENSLGSGTNAQYLRGDKTWQTLDSDVVTEGVTNLYFTTARFDTQFASKTTTNLSEGSNLYFTTSRARTAVSASSPIAYNSSTGVFSMPVSTGTTDGYLSAVDWARFDAAATSGGLPSGGASTDYLRGDSTWAALDTTAVVENGNLYFTDARARAAVSATSPLSYNSGTGVFSIDAASTSTNGYLSSTDWNTFNNKQNPLTFSTGLTNTAGTVTSNISTGIVGGQTIYGGTAASDALIIQSTSNATRGYVNLNPNGGSVGVGTASPTGVLTVNNPTSMANPQLIQRLSQNGATAGNLDFYVSGGTNLRSYIQYQSNSGYGNTQLDFAVNPARVETPVFAATSKMVVNYDVSGLNISSYPELYVNGQVGIGTANPKATLDVVGSIRLGASGDNNRLHTAATSGPASHTLYWGNAEVCTAANNCSNSGTVGGTGTAGQIAYWSSPTDIASSNTFIWDNGNSRLGIGGTPSYTLDVLSTTANQFRLGYNTSNYLLANIASNGLATFDAVGTSAGFRFNDNLTVASGSMFLGVDQGTNGQLTLYSAGAGETAPYLSVNSTGDLQINAPTGIVNVGSGTGDIIFEPVDNNLLTNLSGNGSFLIQDGGVAFVTFDQNSRTTFEYPSATGTAITQNANTLTTGIGSLINANSLTTGQAFSAATTSNQLSSGSLLQLSAASSSSSVAYTGNLANLSLTQTMTGGTGLNSSGRVLNVSRNLTLNNSGQTYTVSGEAFSVSDTFTQTSGTFSITGNTGSISRSCPSGVTCSGSLLQLTASGAGTDTAGLTIRKTAGTMTNAIVIGSGTESFTRGLVFNSTSITTDLVLHNGATIDNDTSGVINFVTATSLRTNAPLLPATDNTINLGSGSFRFNTVFASNGTINTSDSRLKTDVTDLSYGINEIMQLRPVAFNWRDQENQNKKLGLIA
jgi:hypothetical protein